MITLTWPRDNDRMGPGFHYQGTTDLVGPFPQTWTWLGSLESSGAVETTMIAGLTVRPILNQFSGFLGYQNDPGTSLFRPTVTSFPPNPIAITETWRFTVKLVNDAGVTEDQTSVPVTLDTTSGLVSLLERKIRDQAGLTPAQDAALMSTNAAVQLDLGSGFFQPISALLGNMPPSLLQRELITPDRTGEGDLTRPGGALTVAAQGLMWQVVSAPVGIGIDEGAPDTYEIDVLQLGFVRSLNDGSTYFGDTSVIRQPVGVWAWGSVTPTRIHYWITPGVTIRFWWLNPWWGVLAPPSWYPSPPASPAGGVPQEPLATRSPTVRKVRSSRTRATVPPAG